MLTPQKHYIFALTEAQSAVKTCEIDLKEVYDASDKLKDLKQRIANCGDNVSFSNPISSDVDDTQQVETITTETPPPGEITQTDEA